ncbi:MAG: 1-acyl-sn-glycerol-3-phosphate acyltransferase, partial [Halobacteriovoraceae bacterium]|nr:1-acyl-sn-glycerol-3-phosphate acyltransferase [Halobacteriovoraceae bacterium]
RNRRHLIQEINTLANLLEKNIPVMIFPEATSTDGSSVLPFKSPLFKACVKKEIPVLPFTLNYTKIDNRPLSLKNRDFVCWYGDMAFAPHFWKLLNCRSIDATTVKSPALYLSDYRKLAEEGHKIISSFYTPPVCEEQK